MNELSPLSMNLLELFQGVLRDVRFPDADGERLGAAIDAAAGAASVLTLAEAAVEAARVSLADKQRIVVQETERTLAYARVYAAERPELRAALDALTTRAPTRRGPGRPRKTTAPLSGEPAEPAEPAEETAAE